MDTEEFTIFFSNERMSTVRAGKAKRRSNIFTGSKSLTTDLTLILTITAIVVIDVMMGSTAQRANSIFGDGFAVTSLNGFDRLTILPQIVFKKELPVLFDKSFENRKFIHFEFLIFGRMGIVESPLFKWNISADKI